MIFQCQNELLNSLSIMKIGNFQRFSIEFVHEIGSQQRKFKIVLIKTLIDASLTKRKIQKLAV